MTNEIVYQPFITETEPYSAPDFSIESVLDNQIQMPVLPKSRIQNTVIEPYVPEYKLEETKPKGQVVFKHENTNVGNMQPLIDKFLEHGINFRITSGVRPGAKTKQGRLSWHAQGEALDITPIAGQTFEDLRQQMKNSPGLIQWMRDNTYGVYDETTPEVLEKTGGTGAHWHVGKDRVAIDGLEKLILRKGGKIKRYQKGDVVYWPFLKKNENNTKNNITTSVPLTQSVSSKENTRTKGYQKQYNLDQIDEDRGWFTSVNPMKSTDEWILNHANYNNWQQDQGVPQFNQKALEKYKEIWNSAVKSYNGTLKNPEKYYDFFAKLAMSESRFNPNPDNQKSFKGLYQVKDESSTDGVIQTHNAFNRLDKILNKLDTNDQSKMEEKNISLGQYLRAVWKSGEQGAREFLHHDVDRKDGNNMTNSMYTSDFYDMKKINHNFNEGLNLNELTHYAIDNQNYTDDYFMEKLKLTPEQIIKLKKHNKHLIRNGEYNPRIGEKIEIPDWIRN